MSIVSETPSLHQQVAALSYKQLQERIAAVHQSIQCASARQDAQAQHLHSLNASVGAREQSLLLEHGGTLPDSDPELDELRAAAQEAKQKLRAMPEELAKLREVSAVLQQEAQTRAQQLDDLARRQCHDSWQGKASQYVQAARRVIAEAALAEAHAHTIDPAYVDISAFISGTIHPLEVQAIFRAMAEKEKRDTKQTIIEQDKSKRFG